MNPIVKEKWLEKLRAGALAQTREVLKDNVGYCCLGVLCEVAIEEGVPVVLTENEEGAWTYGAPRPDDPSDVWESDVSDTQLPRIVAEWADLETNPELPGEAWQVDIVDQTGELSLAAINDNGHTFDEIADLIEMYL